MSVRIALFMVTTPLVLAATSTEASSRRALRFEPIFDGRSFERPMAMLELPGSGENFLVAEQRGKIWLVRKDGKTKPILVANLSSLVRRKHGEEGLLSMALDSRFRDTQSLFVYYCASRPRRTVLARIDLGTALAGGAMIRAPAQVLLEVPQPYGNHNGGTVVFGPDGMLYLGIGDGGSGGDPHGHGQNLGTLLGTIVRLDVHPARGGGLAVPSDNPFVRTPGARPEIWAYGLRNPWRMSFDSQTGRLWAGDVGQSSFEEVNLIERGGNYGWNLKEGRRSYSRSKGQRVNLVDPVFDYGRQRGQSITGGHVYRGQALSGLRGAYIFGDFSSRRLWALATDGPKLKTGARLGRAPCQIASFAEDRDGELYVICLQGRILSILGSFVGQ